MAHTIPYSNTQIDNAVQVGKDIYGTSGLIKSDGAGNITSAVPNTDYLTPASIPTTPNILKGDNAGGITSATQGTDYSLVDANPVLDGTETDLTSIEIDGTKYKLAGGGGGFTPQIIVTAPTGSTVTCTKGGTTLTATEDSGTWTFNVTSYGTWTILATRSGKSESGTVTVDEVKQYSITILFDGIYGISKTYTDSGTSWTRTDDAVGLSATAGIGTSGYSSDFDSFYPWSEMKRETLSTGDVMVKIPVFWFKRERDGSTETIQIASSAVDGFSVHPLFTTDGSTKAYDYVYVSAYRTVSGYYSKSGYAPLGNATRATFRSNSVAKGTGWQQFDIASWSAIQMLYLVEFADNNSQAKLGMGWCDSNNTGTTNTGGCDAMYNAGVYSGRPSGTDGQTQVMYRSIEDPFGNQWCWVDGINWNYGTYYVCFNPSNYADDTSTNYTQLSYTGSTSWSGSYITEEGLDTNNPAIMTPSAVSGGSSSTYLCDVVYTVTDWRVCRCGGHWSIGSGAGLFTFNMNDQSSSNYERADKGGRLVYRPA